MITQEYITHTTFENIFTKKSIYKLLNTMRKQYHVCACYDIDVL